MNELKRKRRPGAGRPRKPKAMLPSDGSKLNLDTKPGLAASILRLRAAEIQAARDYELARTTGDTDLLSRCQRQWVELAEQLRKTESTSPEVEKANAATLPLATVEREFSRMATAFRVAVEALPRSLPPRLVGLDEPTASEVLRQALAECLDQLATKEWKPNDSTRTN